MINTKSKRISFNCQDYSRARVHFQLILSGSHPYVAQPRRSFQFILQFACSSVPSLLWLGQREVGLLDPQQQIPVSPTN